MLDTYFFIPANKPKFIDGIKTLNTDFFIFDLEDTVPELDLDESIQNILPYINKNNIYVRPSLFNGEQLKFQLLDKLYKAGFRHFVLPKLKNLEHTQLILERIPQSINNILLVEHPNLILDLKEILQKYKNYFKGLGFGSQDYSMFTGLKQDLNQMNLVRFQLNQFAISFNLSLIDTASMNINNMKLFESECVNAFSLGCDAKFLIHPKQLEVARNAKYFSDEEIEWGIKAYNVVKNIDFSQISAYNIGGVVIEKPHQKKIYQIMKYLKEI